MISARNPNSLGNCAKKDEIVTAVTTNGDGSHSPCVANRSPCFHGSLDTRSLAFNEA